MYQTVGHMGIEKLAEAMELPLYRRTTSGSSAQRGKTYEPRDDDDEVEDLFQLLKEVKVCALNYLFNHTYSHIYIYIGREKC